MRHRVFAAAASASVCVLAAAALAQQPPYGQNPGGVAKPAAVPTVQATVETAPLNLVFPDRYAVPVVLEPNRKVFLMAPSDGMLKSVSAPVGTIVREGQEIAQLDRAESAARVKIAEADVKEAQANLKSQAGAVEEARLDAAKARAELSQIDLERCTIRAPFGGQILTAPVPAGQYVSKLNTLAELADNAILKVLVPVDRTAIKAGADLELFVEGKPISGRVSAMVPLPEGFALLRELATPWAGAWVSINNSAGALEPGQRVRGPFAPTQPISTVPTRAVKIIDTETAILQVIRANVVLDVAVKVIGDAGFDRTQISGPFLPNDAVIVATTVPMAAGTVIRFSGEPPVSGAAGTISGDLVDVTPPIGGPVTPGVGSRVAPIGSPDANVPKGAAKGTAKTGTGKAASKIPTKAKVPAGGSSDPF